VDNPIKWKPNVEPFLSSDEIIDYENLAVRTLARQLRGNDGSVQDVAARCFRWVRDAIRHSLDANDDMVTVSASDVLRERTGLCYAKSHLLAALLRANNIPCGFVYQRLWLGDTGTQFCLHGLNAVWLKEYGWYRIDARGNRTDIKTEFSPPTEYLAFAARLPGETTFEQVFPRPLPVVISRLRQCTTMETLGSHLPDWSGEPLS
jgi:transglutaminase-like putative cysteine protease